MRPKPKARKVSSTRNELKENDIWNEDKMDRIRKFIQTESKKQSQERKLRNELLSIKYMMEDAFMQQHKLMLHIYVNFLQQLLDDIPFDNERKRFGVLQLPGGEWRETFDDVLADISAITHVIDEL